MTNYQMANRSARSSLHLNFGHLRFGHFILLCALCASARDSSAGPLTPPPGPVAPTPGPEPRTAINATNTPGDADSLFRITQPGSYYLESNITGVVGKHGVEIAASGVTLDLNGFDLAGVPAMGAFDGVSATASNLTNIAVVNGSVRSWGGDGVDLGSSATTNCRVADLLARANAGNGISTSDSGMVSNCSARFNSGTGIFTGNGCTVWNCSAFQNTGHGIFTPNGCTVSNCSTSSNTVSGISTNSGSTVSNCSASSNGGSGISTGNGSTVADCTARTNTLDGIVCTSACVIRGNTCSANGSGAGDGASIHATGTDNRIEGNNCSTADRGIDVDTAGNIIIRNTCAGNTTDWDIVANNIYGPIIDRRVPASAAVTGFAAVTTLGSTDPNANFSY